MDGHDLLVLGPGEGRSSACRWFRTALPGWVSSSSLAIRKRTTAGTLTRSCPSTRATASGSSRWPRTTYHDVCEV